MRRTPRLTETERLSIAREWAEGVPVQVLAARYGVSRMSIYNAANRDKVRQKAVACASRMIGTRLSERELRGFDAGIARRGLTHRQDAMRQLMMAADKILQADEAMNERLGGMNAEIKRLGGKVNQVARQLNEAKMRGEPPPYTEASHARMRELAGLVINMADDIQEMFRARRQALEIKVNKALGVDA